MDTEHRTNAAATFDSFKPVHRKVVICRHPYISLILSDPTLCQGHAPLLIAPSRIVASTPLESSVQMSEVGMRSL